MNIFAMAFVETSFIKTNMESFKKHFSLENVETVLNIAYNELGVSISAVDADGDFILNNISKDDYLSWKEGVESASPVFVK